MKISLYVSPSKRWWTYLALKSNPSLYSFKAMDGATRAIFFDSLANLPKNPRKGSASRYVYICWDGISKESGIDQVSHLLGANLTVAVVGDSSLATEKLYRVQYLYPQDELHFTASPPFDARTSAILLLCRVKSLLIPLKNLLQQRENLAQQVQLLLGKKKIVFCGSYGTIPKVIAELCKRHSVDPHLFHAYRFYCAEPQPSFETYLEYLQNNGKFLADLYDHGQINGKFLLSAIHLLGREYFIERIRASGLDLFVHGYASGTNINVYSTPFYAQHVFIDFGSAAGKGNYPRLADLRYFKKKLIALDIDSDLDTIANLARSGLLGQHFEEEWTRKSPLLFAAMR